MSECEHCGASLTNLAYSCNYCGQDNCGAHRLPEKHDCIALALTRPPESSKAEADARPGAPRDFHGGDLVDYVEAFRDEHVGEDEEPDVDAGQVRETLEDEVPDAPTDEVSEAAEHVASELNEPSAKPYSTFEPTYTVGTTPEPDYSPSPDMAPDGSLKYGNEGEGEPMEEGISRGFAGVPKEILIVLALVGTLALLLFLL